MNETEQQTEQQTERADRLAYTKAEAAKVLGISRWTLWREIKRRKIYPTKTHGLITREECLRYLRSETEATKRTKRFPRVSRPGAPEAEPSFQ